MHQERGLIHFADQGYFLLTLVAGSGRIPLSLSQSSQSALHCAVDPGLFWRPIECAP